MAQFLDYTGLGHFKSKNDALYAKQDGSYEQMTVGNAEQLVSTVGVEDSAPYTFRTTGGSVDVGDRMNLKAVVGGTVAWNQLVQNGNFNGNTDGWTISGSATKSVSNNVLTLTSSAISSSYQTLPLANANGHRILFCGTVSATASANFGIYKNSSGTYATGISPADGTKVRVASVITLSATSTDVFDIRFRANTANSTTITAENINVFDLTAMFGSAVADYIYTLEQSNRGSGIAWLKSYGFFTKPYYPYAAASLQSVKTSAHKTIGFNQWDEQWESGYFDSNGVKTANANYIRSKNYIPCFPSTVYYFKRALPRTNDYRYLYYYDKDHNFISSYSSGTVNATITTPANAYYMMFAVQATTYLSGICINLHWDGERDGEYEPYEEHTYALDDVELRGIPKLDASNNLYYDGDRYLPDGTVERYFGVRAYTSGDATDGSTMITDGTNTVYELATPTTESADAYTELQICNDFGTEEFVDAATRDFDMPCGSLSVYQPNLRAKLEMAPNSPSNGNGDYIVRQTDGVNEYVLFSEVKEVPDLPTTDGTYTLKCTVADGTATLSWVSE